MYIFYFDLSKMSQAVAEMSAAVCVAATDGGSDYTSASFQFHFTFGFSGVNV